MKNKLALLLAFLLTISAVFAPNANALTFVVDVGDRPYYEGHRDFWDYGWHYVWVPGHMVGHRWVHGYYMRHWEWNARYVHRRHHWQHSYHD